MIAVTAGTARKRRAPPASVAANGSGTQANALSVGPATARRTGLSRRQSDIVGAAIERAWVYDADGAFFRTYAKIMSLCRVRH